MLHGPVFVEEMEIFPPRAIQPCRISVEGRKAGTGAWTSSPTREIAEVRVGRKAKANMKNIAAAAAAAVIKHDGESVF